MRVINFNLFLLMFLMFIVFIVIKIRNYKIYNKKIKVSCIRRCILIAIIKVILIFIYLNINLNVKNIDLLFLDKVIISICGVIIVFISAEISREIVTTVENKTLLSKYGGQKLTYLDKIYIEDNRDSEYNFWRIILTFNICAIFYGIISEFVFNNNGLYETLIIAVFSTLAYIYIRRTKIYLQIKK